MDSELKLIRILIINNKKKNFQSIGKDPAASLALFQGDSWRLNIVCSKDSDDYQDETLDLGVSLDTIGSFRTLNIFDPQGRRQLVGFECSLHSEYRQDGGDKGL